MELGELRKKYQGFDKSHPDILSDFYLIASEVIGVATSGLTPYIDIDHVRVSKIEKLMDKHIKGIPTQKLIGYSVFYDCYIPYSKHTLTPRMETEILVEKVIESIGNKNKKVLDLCCGSGCIGIAIAKNTCAEVVLADVSKFAIKESKNNAKLNHCNVEVIKTDMFSNIKEKFDIIVCNPPYIPKAEYDNLDILVKNNDPKLALVAGEDGLDYYRLLAKESKEYLISGGKLFLEIGYNQGEKVKELLLKSYKNVKVIKDYSDNDRIVIAYSE